eukprot:8112518-Pyramimonas_sp.AAC.1
MKSNPKVEPVGLASLLSAPHRNIPRRIGGSIVLSSGRAAVNKGLLIIRWLPPRFAPHVAPRVVGRLRQEQPSAPVPPDVPAPPPAGAAPAAAEAAPAQRPAGRGRQPHHGLSVSHRGAQLGRGLYDVSGSPGLQTEPYEATPHTRP